MNGKIQIILKYKCKYCIKKKNYVHVCTFKPGYHYNVKETIGQVQSRGDMIPLTMIHIKLKFIWHTEV